jgi:hypothetical protein
MLLKPDGPGTCAKIELAIGDRNFLLFTIGKKDISDLFGRKLRADPQHLDKAGNPL